MNHPTVSQAPARARGRLKFAGPVLVAATVATVFWVSAGQLDPPAGAINPTGPTTLNQQDIGAGPLFSITTSGSYILTSDIVAPGGYTGHGIVINAGDGEGVTLDLNGFSLIGVAGSGDGINVPCCLTPNVVIRNGYVRSWGGYGIHALSRVARIERITAARNGGWGIYNDPGSADTLTHIISCEAQFNGFLMGATGGIQGSQGTIVDSIARGNTGTGINSGASSVTGCVAVNNNGNGIVGGGSFTGCTSTRNTGDGIKANIGSTVSGCTALNNTGDGIEVSFNSTVIGNNCSGNDAVGINLAGRRSRIEGNNVQQNGTGIGGVGIKNLIIKNSAARNATNYNISADNAVGEIVDVTATGGAPFTSGSPWANFIYEPAAP